MISSKVSRNLREWVLESVAPSKIWAEGFNGYVRKISFGKNFENMSI